MTCLEKAIFNTFFDSKLYSCRTILYLLFGLYFSIFLSSCGPTSIYNNHGPDKNLANTTGETRGGGGGGTGDGGGGQGISCNADVKDKSLRNRLFVRDIFEAITNHRRTMKVINSPFENSDKVDAGSIKVLVDSIKLYFGPASSNLDFATESFWTDFANKISFVNEETPLFPSNDANSPIALPVGCEIVQIAYWDESAGSSEEGTLYVDQKRWRQLDQFNKIALLSHEFFFKQARKAKYKSSDFVRNKVGQLLSTEGLEPLFKDWVPASDPRIHDLLPDAKDGFKVCTGNSSEDPSAQLLFYQYKGKDNFQHFVFPMLKSNSINFSLLQPAHFVGFNPKENLNLSAMSDLWVYDSEFPGKTDDLMTSNLEGDEDLFLSMRYNGSGTLFEKSKFSIGQDIREALNILGKYGKAVLWSNYINTMEQPIQVSIINSVLGKESRGKDLKSWEDLIVLANKQIESRFLSISKETIGNRSFQIKQEALTKKILIAISILNSEIEDAARIGIYPEGFPKWNSSLHGLSKELSIFYTADHPLKKDLPAILYKLNLNTYGERDIEEYLGREVFQSFRQDFQFSNEPGNMFLKQGNLSLNFKLKCNGYATIFNATTKSDNGSKMSSKSKSPININYKIEDNDFRSNHSGSKAEELKSILEKVRNRWYKIPKFHPMTEIKCDIENLVSFFISEKTSPEKYQKFWSKNFDACDGDKWLNCDELNMLASDLNDETSISVVSCNEYFRYSELYSGLFFSSKNNKPARRGCFILKMNSKMNNYFIYFENQELSKAWKEFLGIEKEGDGNNIAKVEHVNVSKSETEIKNSNERGVSKSNKSFFDVPVLLFVRRVPLK